MSLLSRLQASVSEVADGGNRERVRVAPFTAYLDPVRALKYMSFAIPDEGTAHDAQPVLGPLRDAFAARDRVARVEYVEDLCPGLAPVLEAGGWALSERVPLMTCTPQTLTAPPAPAGVEIAELGPRTAPETVRAFLTATRISFEDPEPVTDEHVEAFRARSGWIAVAGVAGGEVVATAQCTVPALGVVETVAVTTLAAHRGRGLAGALTAAAVARAFAAGVELAWLCAASDSAERIYARAGFAGAGRQAAYDAAA